MVHLYNCFNKNFAVDTESGSIFEVDDFAFKVIQGEIEKREGKASADLGSEYDIATKEVAMMMKEKVLFADGPVPQVPEYTGLIKSMCLNISHACDLKCGYCFAKGGDYGTGDTENMSSTVAKKAIDFLIERSQSVRYLEVDFFGGEPLLNFELVKSTVEYAKSLEKKHKKTFRFTLTTNCYSLDDNHIDFINKHVDSVILSIDGRENVHNLVRKTADGKGSFSRVVDAAKKIVQQRKHKNYFVRGTFTSQNLDFCKDVEALYNLGFCNISLEPVVLDKRHPLAIKQGDIEKIKVEYEKLAQTILDYRAAGKWLNFFHFNIDPYNTPCESKLLRGCASGSHYIAVSPDGKIYPCHQFIGSKKHLLGDVLTSNISRVAQRKIAHFTHVNAKPKCIECWAKYYCGGGCVYNSIKYAKAIAEPYEIGCELQKKRVECALAVYSVGNLL